MKLFIYKNHKDHPFGKIFQIRWKEPLGRDNCPYLYRWTLILFGFTVRLHHWLRSDDNRYFHDHSCDLISIILKGSYYNVIPLNEDCLDTKQGRKIHAKRFRPWFAKAEKKHYLEIPSEGAWTLLFQGRPYHSWGFYVNNNSKNPNYYHRWRPLRYFSKFGIIQDESYTGLHNKFGIMVKNPDIY